MSYRTIKRLLGETSLERKCRLLLGGGIFALILLSFFCYGYQTEKLVWDQTRLTAQLLVNPVLLKLHWESHGAKFANTGDQMEHGPAPARPAPSRTITKLPNPTPINALPKNPTHVQGNDSSKNPTIVTTIPPHNDVASNPNDNGDKAKSQRREQDKFVPGSLTADFEDPLPDGFPHPNPRVLRPVNQIDYDAWAGFAWARNAMHRLQTGKQSEVWENDREKKVFRYIKAVHLRETCMKCHPTAKDKFLGCGDLKEGDLIAAIHLQFPLERTELAVNVNRAILLSFAIGAAILAMLFAYITVRYVIVKPVAHLKEVSEEIASGNLTIRSNIQTGDEFQELSLAFNRMLRSLVSMQDELRRVNTDLDQKLDELAQANMSLFEMNRFKSEFLANISHELRTPLNSIIGFGDLIAEQNVLQGKQKRWVQNIQSSGKLLLNLINDILDLAKIESGKMQLHLEEFSLRDLVEGQIQMHAPQADKKNIAIRADIDSGIPILHQDSQKLQQVLANLLTNAIKFTPEGGQIAVTCKTDRTRVALAVMDNGIGIAPEDHKIIFEKFRQAESSLTRNHGGTGLGLSIVRELTKLLGGDEVELESELGRGSTFTIRIPMHLSDKQTFEELHLGDTSIDFSARQDEVRFYSSKDRTARSDVN